MLVRKIIWMMSSAMAMTVIMVVSITAWTAQRNNDRAAADTLLMVRGSLDGRFNDMAALNADYSAWNAGLRATLDREVPWIAENMGSGANGREFHVLEIHWPTDWTSLTWTDESNAAGAPPSSDAVVPAPLMRRVHAALNAETLGEGDTKTFALERDGNFYLAAATRMQPWIDAAPVPPETLPINVMAYRLTDASLDDIGSKFLITDLMLSTTRPSTDIPHISLHNLEGEPIVHLTWTPPRPGDVLIQTAAVPVGFGLLLFLGLAGSVTMTARRNAADLVLREQEAVNAARTDPMTGLPNRMAFNESLAIVRREKIEIAVLFMDLNGFKAINDEYGHHVGDTLLREIASLSHACKREQDMLARLGGDEFNIIFPGPDAERMCQRFCQTLTLRLAATIRIKTLEFQPKIAMGYSVGHTGSDNVSELMRQADYAMYAAKLQKSEDPIRYNISLERDKLKEVEMTAALRKALENGDELSVVYQPIVDAQTGELRLAEALVRWNSAMLGTVPPGAFISIAEKTGLIVEVGRRVMEMVFRDLAEMPDLRVSINLSPVQLRSRSILADIKTLVERYEIDPRRVSFEVTEGVMIECSDLIAFVFDSLRETGFALALDDFGTGFSSIGYLRKFEFDTLKIDKSFVDDIGIAPNSQNLMRALVYLARSLDMKIVAEGVETQDQSQRLREEGYDLLQGYLFSRPLSFDALKDFRGQAASSTDHQARRVKVA